MIEAAAFLLGLVSGAALTVWFLKNTTARPPW